MIGKYIGQIVEIIYLDRKGRISKRRIQVHSIRGGVIRAYCMTAGAPRTFRTDCVLAVQPVDHRAG